MEKTTSFESNSGAFIPEESSDWQNLQESLSRAIDALSSDESDVIKITSVLNDEEGIKSTEKYLKDNFDKLSQAQKDFLLTSLRVKNYRLQNNIL